MGDSLLADIPGPHAGPIISNASAASGGASAHYGMWVAPHDLKIRGVWRTVDADEDPGANGTASYRRLRVLNGGASGTATTILASLNQTASQASKGKRAYTLATSPTAAEGDIIVFDQITVGGAETNGTVLRAGQTHVAYEML